MNKIIKAEIYKIGNKWYKKTVFRELGEVKIKVEEISLPIKIYNEDGSLKYCLTDESNTND